MELGLPGDRGRHVREVRRGRAHHGSRGHDALLAGLPPVRSIGLVGEI